MITQDQTSVIEFLCSPSTHGGVSVERIDTHISIVVLAGARAWKLKRAVRFDYIDASTPERRKALCEKEVQLNRRTAPSIYRRAVAVTRETDGSLALDGSGPAVEWVVEMNRFDQDQLLDRLAERGSLALETMAHLASAIAAFHRAAEPRRDHGGRTGMAWVVDGNAAGFAEFGAGVLDPVAAGRVISQTRAALDRCGSLLDARREAGLVRQCHGDLHLRNIVMYGGEPTIFDAIEFNDEIACVDVFYDLAFLLMDLWRRRLFAHANVVWNRYLKETGDLEGLALMPLFLSCRAAIRAKTSATALRMQTDPRRLEELRAAAPEYLAMAEQLLNPAGPSLIAVGGLSGSGKSTMARALAPRVGPVPGAVVLRSDEVRKELFGVAGHVRLGADAYSEAVTDKVYATLAERADRVLRGGYSAILDAVFLQAAERQRAEAVARAAGVPFVGLWLEAPQAVLLDRLRARQHDVSDADAAVLQMQLARDPGAIAWHRVDASRPADALLDEAIRLTTG